MHDYQSSSSDDIATAIVDELSRSIAYRPAESDGNDRAAQRLADLI